MNRFFQSRFWSAMNFLGTAFILNVFWLLGCLPVVTAGASTAALCQCYFRLFTNREESLPRLFLKGFRSCFKQATPAWLVQLFFAADVALILWTRKQAIALPWLLTNKLSLALGIVITLLMLTTLVYIYGMIAYYDLSMMQCLTNCLGLSFRHIGKTLLMLAMTVCTGFLIYIFPPLAMLGGSLCCAAQCRVMLKLFESAAAEAAGAKKPENSPDAAGESPSGNDH